MDRRQGDPPSSPLFATPLALIAMILAILPHFLPLPDGPLRLLYVPHLVLVPVFFLTLQRRQGVGAIGAFCAGLVIDILTFGPLGVTAASFTIVHLLLTRERDALILLPRIFRLAMFALATAFVLLVAALSLAYLGPGAPDLAQAGFVLAGLWVTGLGFDLAVSRSGQEETKPGYRGTRHRSGRSGRSTRGKRPRRKTGVLRDASPRPHITMRRT